MGYGNSYLCESGTTILGRKGTINNPLYIETKFWNVDTAFGITAKDGNSKKYIYYFVKSQDWSKKDTGTTLPSLTQKVVKETIIPVPPLSEQHRIVSYLDAAFAKIDAVAKNAEDALNEAKALFQSALAKMMEPKEGWEEKKIRDIADVRSGYAFKSSEFKPNGKYQVLRIGNVKRGIILYHVAPVFMPDSLASVVVNKSILKKGDIIITQTGTKSKGDYGYTAIVDCDNLLLNQRVARLRVNKEINLTFLLFYTWTKYFRDQFFSNEGGMVGQGNVSLETIKQIKIIYPSIEEQVEIVSLLSTIYHKIELLESNLSRTLTECAALKQSILRQTFE